jgi:hypothetical protein
LRADLGLIHTACLNPSIALGSKEHLGNVC